MHREGEEIVSQIKDAANLVALIEHYIPLKPRGKNFVALCPFHEEKTASFYVSVERQTFKCFGCGKSGDVFSFIQEFEKVGFREAMEIVAEWVGIQIPQRGAKLQGDEKALIRKTMQFAVRFYQKALQSSEGEAARKYLTERGITQDTVRDFGLGFAPDAWERLKQAAAKAGLPEGLCEKAGLCKRNENGRIYDRFRHRVMIPIADTLGRPIGFGARVLNPQDAPKYLNSPDTALFTKGRCLYGLDRAKHKAAERGKVYIVEGYTDVILAVQHGIHNVVAALGTAFTPDHAKMLRRYVTQVVLVFDGDEAGQNANARGIELLLEEDLDVSVVILPENVDPADLAQQGQEALQGALAQEIDFFDFALERIARHCDFTTIAGKTQAADKILLLLGKVPSPVKRDLIFARMAERLHVSERALRERFSDLLRGGQIQRAPKIERYSQSAAPARGEKQQNKIEKEILSVVLFDPSLLPVLRERLRPEIFEGEGYEQVYREMLSLYEERGTLSLPLLMERMPDNPCHQELSGTLEAHYEEPLKTVTQLLRALQLRQQKNEISRLKYEARSAKQKGDEAGVDARHVEINRLLQDKIAQGRVESL